MGVRSGKSRCVGWAAWLGVFALALNALVPIHLAFDLAAAFGAAQPSRAHSVADDREWSVLAQLSGHGQTDADSPERGKSHQHGKGQPTPCQICSALGALAGFVPAAAVALPLPPPAPVPTALAAIGGEPARVPLAYRSRAPPIA